MEIVLTVMIIGITITALVSGLASVAGAGNAHRVGVESDTVLRNAAEALKSAARECTAGASLRTDLVVPAGFVVAFSPDDTSCPDVRDSRRVEVSVVAPGGIRQAITVVVRTP